MGHTSRHTTHLMRHTRLMRCATILAAVSGVLSLPFESQSVLHTKTNCPAVSPLADLNQTEYLRASWFIQRQQLTGYQQPKDLFCVATTYIAEKKTVPFFSGEVLSVYNYENLDKVNGQAQGATTGKDSIVICARQKDPSKPGELLVAPCFLPNILAGPYWVGAVGPTTDNYEWAVVSGGQPTEQYSDGCTTKQTGTNGSGFWFLTRAKIASKATIAAQESAAKALGFTLSQMHDVAQQGCTYHDAKVLKPDARLN